MSKAKPKHLAHEVGDDAVKFGALEVQRFALLAHALLASAKRTEVLGRLGHDVGEQLQNGFATRNCFVAKTGVSA